MRWVYASNEKEKEREKDEDGSGIYLERRRRERGRPENIRGQRKTREFSLRCDPRFEALYTPGIS